MNIEYRYSICFGLLGGIRYCIQLEATWGLHMNMCVVCACASVSIRALFAFVYSLNE